MPRGSHFGSGSKATRKAKSRASSGSAIGSRGSRAKGKLKALTIGKKKKKK